MVYRGVWSHSKKHDLVTEEVAVKTMEEGASEDDRVKFLQEAAIMGQFNHPNIISLLGIIPKQENRSVSAHYSSYWKMKYIHLWHFLLLLCFTDYYSPT